MWSFCAARCSVGGAFLSWRPTIVTGVGPTAGVGIRLTGLVAVPVTGASPFGVAFLYHGHMANPNVRKPDRQERDTPKKLSVVPAAMAKAPEPDKAWLSRTKTEWALFWGSEVASLVDGPGEIGLRRLFELVDERHRVRRALAKEDRVVVGSTGQPTLHPLVKDLRALEANILQLEDRYGFSARAKLNIGVQVVQARQSLEKLNASLAAGDDIIEVVDD